MASDKNSTLEIADFNNTLNHELKWSICLLLPYPTRQHNTH